MIYNIVTTPKITLMDSMLLTAGNAMRDPSAYPILMETPSAISAAAPKPTTRMRHR